MIIYIRPKTVIRLLFLVITLLLFASMVGIFLKYELHHDTVFGLVPMFDMDRENSIPTLFASFLLLLISLILFLIAQTRREIMEPGYYHWVGLGFVFLFLTIDEFVSIHERFTTPIRESLNLSGLLFFSWILPYFVVTLILLIMYLPFLLKLPFHIRKLMIIAAFVYLSGALGMESIGGYYFEQNNQHKGVIFAVMSSVEEFLELSGSVIFIYALFSYLTSECSNLSIRISEKVVKK